MMADEDSVPMPEVIVTPDSPEAIWAAPIARDLIRAKLDGNKFRFYVLLTKARMFREGELEGRQEGWHARQYALNGCLAMVAAEALREGGFEDSDAIEAFLMSLDVRGITL